MSSKEAALRERLSQYGADTEELVEEVLDWEEEWSSNTARTGENPMGWSPVNPSPSTGNR